MIIIKGRSTAFDWAVYHASLGNTTTILLNSSGAALAPQSFFWQNTTPTSSVIYLGSWAELNASSATQVAYCWAEIAGFSKFGSYTGNGSSDGPFVYLGFRPKFVMTKRTDSTSDWVIMDSSRNTYNPEDKLLYPNLSNAEDTLAIEDFLSNGFKFRNASTTVNASSGTYIYMAFAENPFKNSLAR
jgi:hypothetical protein